MQKTNLRTLDLNLLLVFDALLAERNVTRAGERVGLSQPAVSRALGRLRHYFGDPLFVRNRGTMEPTARAMALALPVRRGLEQIAQGVGLAPDFDPARAEAQVLLATADYMEIVFLPALMHRLAREAPRIEIVSRPITTATIAGRLNTGRADLALWPLALDTGDLRSTPLLREEMVCIAAHDHPAIRDGLTLALFHSLPHLRISPEGEGTSAVDNVLAARGLKRRTRATVTSHAAAPRIVTETEMIATVPQRVARIYQDAARLRVWPLPVPIPGFTVDMVWPQRLDQHPVHGWLRGIVREVAGEL